jgi:hypothetical protein
MTPGQVFALSLLLGTAGIGGIVAILVKTGIGRAIADAISHNSGADAGRLKREEREQLVAEVDQLRGELDGVHAQLAEVQERLDFAERLLASGRDPVQKET